MRTLRDLPRSTGGRLIISVLALGVVGAGLFVGWPRGDPAPAPTAAAGTPPNVPILVSASLRPGDAQATAGVPMTVSAHALGAEPIGFIELWAGEERVAVHAAPSTSPSLHVTLSWTPEREGPAIVVARAIDALGRVAQSNALRVGVAAAAPGIGMWDDIKLAVAPGSPDLALAVPAVQVTLAECIAEVTVTGVDPEATGLVLYDLLPSAPAFAPAGTAPATEASQLSVPLTSGLHLFAASAFDDVAEVYSDPIEVQVPPGCATGSWTGPVRLDDGNLVLPHAVDRAYAYLTVDAGAAVRLPADPNAFIEPVDGIYDAAPHLPSLDAQTMAIEAWGWQGDELVSLGTGTWTAPDSGGGDGLPGNSFVMPPGQLGPKTSLYEFHDLTLHSGQVAGCGDQFCVVEELATEIEVSRPPPGVFMPVNRSFRWQTQATGVTDVVWQVFFHEPSATPDLDPPFLVDQGPVPLDDADPGDFVIDLMPYLTGVVSHNVGPGDQAKGAQELLKTVLDPTLDVDPPAPDTTAINLAWLPPAQIGYGGGGGTGGGTGGDPATNATFEVPGAALIPSDLWVRVVPISGSAALAPSNPVHVAITDYDPVEIDASVPDYTDRYAMTMEHTLPVAPNRDFSRCAVIAEVTDDYQPGIHLAWDLYISEGYVCYTPPDDDGWSPFDVFEAFVEWVSDAWDFVSGAWDDIKGLVVDFVLTAVPCDEFASADTCETIAGYALDAALVAVGVPPSIPDFDTTIGALKGEIGQAMIELAGMEGACDGAAAAHELDSSLPTCDDIIDAALQEMVAQVEAQQHEAAANAIGKSVPKGIVLAPHPDGLWTPPSITVTVERISDEPVPVACSVGGSMVSKVAAHTWSEMDQVKEEGSGWWTWKEFKVSGDVSGSPLSGQGFTLPDLALHDTYTQTIWLTNELEWWESLEAKHWEIWQLGGNPYTWTQPVVNHAFWLLQPGAELTFAAGSNCADGVTQVETLTESGSNQ